MSNSIDFLLVISNIKSPIYGHSPQIDPDKPLVVYYSEHVAREEVLTLSAIVTARPCRHFEPSLIDQSMRYTYKRHLCTVNHPISPINLVPDSYQGVD